MNTTTTLRLTQLLCLVFLLACSSVSAQKQGPERWEETIQRFEKNDAKNRVAPGAVLFVGSSSIAKWQDVDDYFPKHRTLNRGFGGSNFTDLIYYAERIITPYQPSKVFVYEGDNDIAQGDSPETILDNARKLRKIIKKALGKEVPVIFISPKPSVARWEMREQYDATNAALKAYAEKTPYTEFADVWTPAIGKDGKVFSHIFLKDNLHMNAEGYEIWQAVLTPFVTRK